MGLIAYEDLDARPECEFFAKSHFSSSTKKEIISDDEYEKVTEF